MLTDLYGHGCGTISTQDSKEAVAVAAGDRGGNKCRNFLNRERQLEVKWYNLTCARLEKTLSCSE